MRANTIYTRYTHIERNALFFITTIYSNAHEHSFTALYNIHVFLDIKPVLSIEMRNVSRLTLCSTIFLSRICEKTVKPLPGIH